MPPADAPVPTPAAQPADRHGPAGPATAQPAESAEPAELAGPDDRDGPGTPDGLATARVPAPRSDADPAGPALTERDLQILAFERRWWKHAGSKEQAIRDTFDLSATRYYQVLNGLLDNPAALAHDALLVGRLRRLRSTRARVRRR